jgi:coenzyme F420-reducing hydrogenase beta subunit
MSGLFCDWHEVGKTLNWGGGPGNLDVELFRKRIVVMARFLNEQDRSVMDLGAGVMYLRELLGNDVKYYPVDIEKRCEKTIVCDFNKGEFPDIKTDAAVLAGVLEYISDVKTFLSLTAMASDKIILSYRSRDKGFDSAFTTDEITSLMNQNGFIVTGIANIFTNEWFIGCFEKAFSSVKKIIPFALERNAFCTGCGACYNTCPSGAVSMGVDGKGFLKPKIDQLRCLSCGQCVSACPVLNTEKKNNNEPEAYGIWADDEVRADSSSGGAFTLLAQPVLTMHGGIVFGAAWTQDCLAVEHIGIRTMEGLQKLRHSKYVQSNTRDTFKEAKTFLETGIPVLYSGTPCQIAGLNRYLSVNAVNTDLLVTIDLVCFGVPPQTAWLKYFNENFGDKEITDVVFRDKTIGWNPRGYKLKTKQHQNIIPDGYKDAYQNCFHNVLFRCDTCENCKFIAFPRHGDLTLGDAWGIGLHDPSWDDGKGTSAVLINTAKGRGFFQNAVNACKRCEKIPPHWLRNKGNRYENDGRLHHHAADRFYPLLKDHSFNDAVDFCLDGKFDIGIVGFWNENYGTNLTTYAMYQVITGMGYTALMLDRPLSSQLKPAYLPFSMFLTNQIPGSAVAGHYPDKKAMKQLNDCCGMFLLQSDQTLRASSVQGYDKFTLLDWVRSEKPMIAYAASFGHDFFDGDDKLRAEMGYFLHRFDAVSVREASGVTLAKEQFNLDVSWVLDPVFLCDKDHYEKMAGEGVLRIPKTPFLGAYILDLTQDRVHLVKEICSMLDLRKNCVITDACAALEQDHAMYDGVTPLDAKVEEWLAMVKYCDFLVTDSFHGICFSIIFRKQFIVIFNDWQWRGAARIHSVLEKFNLENRLIESFDKTAIMDILNTPVNYDAIDAILNKEIAYSQLWLRSALTKGFSVKKNQTAYDIVSEKYDVLSEKYDRFEEHFDQRLRAFEQHILSSWPYRIGRTITWFPRKVRGFFWYWRKYGPLYTVKLFVQKLRRKCGI